MFSKKNKRKNLLITAAVDGSDLGMEILLVNDTNFG